MQPNNVYQGDCLGRLKEIEDGSIPFVLTDPPYFLDKMDNNWDKNTVDSKKYQEKGTISSLPAGMKFDPKQGENFYNFYLVFSKEILRVLKPGGYFLSFSAPRLYHNMAAAVEDAGFYVKDQFIWLYLQNQVKAQGMQNFIKKSKQIPEDQKAEWLKRLEGYKTPQLRSNHETICVAQKPLDGTFLMNHINHGVGLVNCNIKVGEDKFVSNVITTGYSEDDDWDAVMKHWLVKKPSVAEKGDFNDHKTVKPLELCSHLINLFTQEGAVVLDPFVGSGTTCVAAKMLGRSYIGIDKDPKNVEISNRRLEVFHVDGAQL